MPTILALIAIFSIVTSATFYWKVVPRNTAPWHVTIRPLVVMILTVGTSAVMFFILALTATAVHAVL